jgi:hypothetical protein
MAKTLFARGADFLAAMTFMFASTNLVVELGIVLIVLMGWRFAAGEFVGGAIMIVLLVSLGHLWLRPRFIAEAREMLIGYLVAGFLAVLVPSDVWKHVFLSGHGAATSVENVAVGPFIALISFVCSVGNVPLAAALWKGGISFGGWPASSSPT